jgi:hypothetical protein
VSGGHEKGGQASAAVQERDEFGRFIGKKEDETGQGENK